MGGFGAPRQALGSRGWGRLAATAGRVRSHSLPSAGGDTRSREGGEGGAPSSLGQRGRGQARACSFPAHQKIDVQKGINGRLRAGAAVARPGWPWQLASQRQRCSVGDALFFGATEQRAGERRGQSFPLNFGNALARAPWLSSRLSNMGARSASAGEPWPPAPPGTARAGSAQP